MVLTGGGNFLLEDTTLCGGGVGSHTIAGESRRDIF